MKKYLPIFFFLLIIVLSPVTLAQDKKIPEKTHDLGYAIKAMASQMATLNNPAQIEKSRTGFQAAETPDFTVKTPIKTGKDIGKEKKNSFSNKEESITSEVVNVSTGLKQPAIIKKDEEGKFSLEVKKTPEWEAGTYRLNVEAKETSFFVRDLTQDFSWGVIAVNTDKSIYQPHEKAQLSFGVLNPDGGTICNAKIEATITAPDGKVQEYKTEDKSIALTKDCGSDYYTTNPDYIASYKTGNAGTYQMHISATTHYGTHTMDDYFEVKESSPIEVKRSAFPTRIYPVVPYPVTLTIKANEDYSGDISDFVPKAMYISDISDQGRAPNNLALDKVIYSTDSAVLEQDANAMAKYKGNISKLVHQKVLVGNKLQDPDRFNMDHTPMPITWHVNWKKGETYTLKYTIHFPQVPIDFYTLGPAKAGPKEIEARQWQIASDANKCWKGTVNANWSTANNWVTTAGANTSITSSDVAIFDSSTTTCSSNSTANASTISATATVQGLRILTYANTITQSAALNLSTTTGYVQSAASSVFTGNSNNISLTNANGVFNQTNGTFTSTSGTLNVTGNFTHSAGTFNHNNGTVIMDGGAGTSRTSTGATTFYNLKFGRTSAACNGSGSHTIASGTILTVANTLTLDDNDGCNRFDLNGTGTITAQGDITLTHNGAFGTTVVTANGTGTQTITGGASSSIAMPGLTINKTTGTLNFVDNIGLYGSVTYTQGTLNAGTSTIYFKGDWNAGATWTIAGSMSLNNVVFGRDNSCGAGSITSISSGTVITVNGTLYLDDQGGCNRYNINGTGTITANGDLTITHDGAYGTVVITIAGTGTQTLTGSVSATTRMPSLVINKSTGTLNLTNNIPIEGDVTYTAATISPGSSTVYFRGDWINGSTRTVTGSMTLANVVFGREGSCGAGAATTIASGTTITATGDLTLADTGGCNTYSLNGPGTVAVQGNVVISNDGASGTGNISLTGTGSQSITRSAGSIPTGTVTINKASGTASLGSNISLSGSGQDFTIASGTFSQAGFTFAINDVLSMTGGTYQLVNNETLTYGSVSLTGGTVEYTGSGTYTSLLLGNTYYGLTISGSGSFTPSANVTLDGSYSQSAGTFVMPSTFTVGGDFTKSGGTFTVGTGTIKFANASNTSTISGSNTFYNMTINTIGKTVIFTAGTTTTISNTLAIAGDTSGPITLRSTSPGSQWNIITANSTTVTYVAVTDSNACSGLTINAQNSGGGGNNTCWVFSIPTPSISGYSYSKTLTLNSSQISGTLTNFPVLVRLSSDTDLAAHAKSDGSDIVFTDNTGLTVYNFKLESYNNGTGALTAWVRIPSLSSSTNTFKMHYGKPTASSLAAACAQSDQSDCVFDSTFKLVEHMGETPTSSASITDYSYYGNTGTFTGTTSSSVTGVIGNGILFNGTNNRITISSSSSLNTFTDFTITVWVKRTVGRLNQFNGLYCGNDCAGTSNDVFGAYLDDTALRPIICINTTCPTGTSTFSDTSSYHYYSIVFSDSGNGATIYYDGAFLETISNASSLPALTGTKYIGESSYNGDWLGANLDEFRLSNTARSTGWILTEYNNQVTGSTFITLGSETSTADPLIKVNGGVTINGGTRLQSN